MVGYNAGENMSGGYNLAIGYSAGYAISTGIPAGQSYFGDRCWEREERLRTEAVDKRCASEQRINMIFTGILVASIAVIGIAIYFIFN